MKCRSVLLLGCQSKGWLLIIRLSSHAILTDLSEPSLWECGYTVLNVDKSPRHKVSLETSDWLKGDVNHSPYLFSNKIEKKFPLYQETYKPLAYSYGLFPVPNFLSWIQIWKSQDSTWMLLKKTTRLFEGKYFHLIWGSNPDLLFKP
jgi:hypothetical protein